MVGMSGWNGDHSWVPLSSAAYRDDACELLIGRHGCVGLHVEKGRLFNGKFTAEQKSHFFEEMVTLHFMLCAVQTSIQVDVFSYGFVM